ncbi:hypothetical protein BC938DRAFT_475168 [Jimgerdemannia flammicorona]|uniref:C3H1-type domain-containing protein n=1 Tax=Jimgerdemannia flammicorona TaxID=994334 RepID=A0A433PZC2_9FUNG|nr:hypothetical protein BC938DRAFT_475168 [Jimgerdemannia flammicorona]
MEQQSSDNECEAKPHEAPPAQDTEQRLEPGQEVSHRPTKEGTRTTSVEPSLTTLCLANTDTLPPADLGNVLVPSLPTPAITPLVIVEKRRHIPVPLPSLITPTVCASSASLQLQQRSRFILHGIDLTVVRQWDRDTQGEFIPVHVASPASMKKKRQRDDDNESTCKFWVNTGRCDKGEACAFVHVRGENKMKAARREWVEKVSTTMKDVGDE